MQIPYPLLIYLSVWYTVRYMIADVTITEKSFGDKLLMSNISFSVKDGEKVGIVGRNGVGKSTLFGILAGHDTDYTGDLVFKRGCSVVATSQEYHAMEGVTVMEYILHGLPEYSDLKHVIDTYPEHMGDDMDKIEQYTQALQRFDDKGFYQVQQKVERELECFQLAGTGERLLSTLSGGQKRLVEVVKIMHSDAHLALIDEPTNHMDYVAKQQFIDWMSDASEAMLVITHDRDVLKGVDRIIELKDGACQSFVGDYDAYLKQNAHSTSNAMGDFEQIERRKSNLRDKVVQFRRLKERARDPDTIKQFKRRETQAATELEELEKIQKPTFWIDKSSAEQLNHRHASRYEKYKSRNIRVDLKSDKSRSSHVLVKATDVALGYGDTILFEGINIDLREGEALELRGRNGAGKTTLIKALLQGVSTDAQPSAQLPTLYAGELELDQHVRIGVYEQEVSDTYLDMTLYDAIERMYLDAGLTISDTKIRQLLGDYLFTQGDALVPLSRLSGGQKARFQIISMLANDPQLLVLDEPTNHLDLPSIEELEVALERYSGAILFVSHDDYFRRAIDGAVVSVGGQ